MKKLTAAELEITADSLRREAAAKVELSVQNQGWFERTICALTVASVVYLSARWPELPMTASILLAGCAGALPILYFEVRRLRKQVDALIQIALHAKHSDA